MAAVTLRFPGAAALASLALALGACGGGGGGGSAPATPAVIDTGNSATITREVLEVGLGAGSFGAAIGGGGSILSAEGGTGATVAGIVRQRKFIQQVQPSVTIPAETFDCLVSGTVRLSGSLANADTLTAGDRLNATFMSCDDGEGASLDGGLRIDVTAFSGDIYSDQFLLGANVTVTDLGITEAGTTTTGDGSFALDLDLTVPLVSDLTMSGALFRLASGGDDWVLRDFAVTAIEDGRGMDLVTQYSGTGTLEGAGFEGAVDFVTVEPFVATGDGYPGTGDVLIRGANGASIRVSPGGVETLQLAIDLDGDEVVDVYQLMPWSSVGAP